MARSDDNRTQFIVTLPSKEKTEKKEGTTDEVHTHRRLTFRGKTGRRKCDIVPEEKERSGTASGIL